MQKTIAFLFYSRYNNYRVTGCGSVWLERRLREAEAASSNLVTPITAVMQDTPEGLMK